MSKLSTQGKSLTWFVVVAILVGSIGFWLRPAAEAAPATQTDDSSRHPRNPFERINVTGVLEIGGTFRGTMDIVSFTREGDQLFANGILEGTLRDLGGRRIGTVDNVFAQGFPVELGGTAQTAAAPVQSSKQGSAAAPQQTETPTPIVTVTVTGTPGPTPCRILTLDLGPLDLNLLGLRVQLNDIHLRITAEPGPGNLLGNLLCAIAHLLDQNGQLDQITGLLNRIIDLLGG